MGVESCGHLSTNDENVEEFHADRNRGFERKKKTVREKEEQKKERENGTRMER